MGHRTIDVSAPSTTFRALGFGLWLIALSSCSGEHNDDAFTFFGLAKDGSDVVLDRPLAVGAALRIGVRLRGTTTTGGLVDISGAAIHPPELFDIEATGNPLVVRARASGEATLEVAAANGDRGRLGLRAMPIGGVELAATMIAEDIETPLSPGVLASGVVLHPSVSLRLSTLILDAQGVPLLGEDATRWSLDPPEAFELTRAAGGQDRATIRARATAEPTSTSAILSTGLGQDIPLFAVTSTPSAAQLRLYGARTFLTDPSGDEIQGSIELPVGRTRSFSVLGFDDTDRVIAASLEEGLVADSAAGLGEVLAVATRRHLLTIAALTTGRVELELSWLGASRAIEVVVRNQ